MPEQGNRIDLRLGDLAVSLQGFDNPVQPLKQTLRFVQRLIEETPEIAGTALALDDDDLDDLLENLAGRLGVPRDRLTATPGLVIVATPESADVSEDDRPGVSRDRPGAEAVAAGALGAGLDGAGEAAEAPWPAGDGPPSLDLTADAADGIAAEATTDEPGVGPLEEAATGAADASAETPEVIALPPYAGETAVTGEERDTAAHAPDLADETTAGSVASGTEPDPADAPVPPMPVAADEAPPAGAEASETGAPSPMAEDPADWREAAEDPADTALAPADDPAPGAEPSPAVAPTEPAPANIFASDPEPEVVSEQPQPEPEVAPDNIFASDPEPTPAEAEPEPAAANIFASDPEPEAAPDNIFASDPEPEAAPANIFASEPEPEPAADELEPEPEPSPASIFASDPQPEPRADEPEPEPDHASTNIFASDPQPEPAADEPEPEPGPSPASIFASDEEPEPSPANIFASDPEPRHVPAEREPERATANIFASDAEREPATANIFAAAPDPAAPSPPPPVPANIFAPDTAAPSPSRAAGGPGPAGAETGLGDSSGRRLFGGGRAPTGPRWIEDPNEPAPVPGPDARRRTPAEDDEGPRLEDIVSRVRGGAPADRAPEDPDPAGPGAARSGGAAAIDAAELANRAEASSVPELLAASAAWLTLVDKRSTFGRREVMDVFDTIPGEHPRTLEARIKGYGKLVRSGALVLVDDGRFALSQEERDRYRAYL